MKPRIFLPLLLTALAVTLATVTTVQAASNGAKNKDGSIVTGVLTARFDTGAGLEGLPVPNNLYYLGTTDLTINAPTDGLSGTAAALVEQLNALDGFSTIERWTTTFVDDDGNPGSVDPASVIPGESVRVFQVTTQQFLAVTGIIRELTPGVDFTAAVSGNVLAIVPLQPLDEYSSYMAVLTNDINDVAGNDATPDQTYFLTKRAESWVDENGQSTYPLIDDATAQGLAALQPLTASMEGAAASAGINPEDIILSWTVQTQSITPVLGLLRSTVQPGEVQLLGPLGTTEDFGLAGTANYYIGVIEVPYYLGVPSAENPIAPLTDFWNAEPGAYIPPFDQLGLDPTSTNITVANPFPVVTSVETIPVILTVPNNQPRPAGGWPVAIYGHGLGGNRTNMLGLADTLASVGFATVAIDFPLHGIVDANNPFNVANTPFADMARERTFGVDYIDNATGAPGPDGQPDPSGAHALNFQEYRASRDNVRQGVIDMSVLASSLGNFDIDRDGAGDLRPIDVAYTGISWGGINGTVFSAIEPLVSKTFLSVPAGGLVRAGEASQTFGPRIRAGLESVGIFPGDPLFELYLTVGQTVSDAGDPVNWVRRAAMDKPVLLHEVIGDTVLPNFVPGAPLSGTEPLIRVAPLESFSDTQMNPEGLRSAARFVPPATHGSLQSPVSSLEATIEMQGQMASFLASDGTAVIVGNPETMLPVMMPFEVEITGAQEELGDDLGVKAPGGQPVAGPMAPANSLD
jgi:hypothetical protein